MESYLVLKRADIEAAISPQDKLALARIEKMVKERQQQSGNLVDSKALQDEGNAAFQLDQGLPDCPYPAYSVESHEWIKGWAIAAEEARKGWEKRFSGASTELPEDAGDMSYGDLIVELKGERSAWVSSLSDRAAWSLVRDGYNSLQELKKAVEGGLKIAEIPNMGRKEVAEVEQLLNSLEP